VYLADFAAEYNCIDFLNQLTGLDHPQIAATTPGGALGMFGGAGRKILTSFQLGLQLRAGFLCGDYDMTNMSVWHVDPPCLFVAKALFVYRRCNTVNHESKTIYRRDRRDRKESQKTM
jgi:hypothetical protein